MRDSKRQRGHGGGRLHACPFVRRQLFDWWADMRLSIDYSKIGPRFPVKLVKAKWMELLADYAAECIKEGQPVEIPQVITASMVRSWEDEYNLSLRRPNRRYKVPRPVLAERLEIWWTNLLRVRQLILCEFGYDPEMQNFDQSPFHRNEAGSWALINERLYFFEFWIPMGARGPELEIPAGPRAHGAPIAPRGRRLRQLVT